MINDFTLTPERWKRVQGLFHDALPLSEEEREAFLSRACEDPALRTEVEALLQAHADPAAVFGQDPEVLAAGLEVAAETSIGRLIGPYRVLRKLGQGGMGAVYLAERPDIDKQVALKVVRDVFASPERIQRFMLERRVLARLNHPGIARILDAGMADDGAPYFAMEYVEGTSLTDYCDRHRLGVTARLKLFVMVCAAVQDAHRNLIVHRDLKPSNILVTEDPESGLSPHRQGSGRAQVKLLDFGIAKLLEEERGDAMLTQTGSGVMTPAYAAPEQIRGGDVTTATDVYALGLLLYALLTGRLPYEVKGRPVHEIGEAVLHAEPRKPSVMIGAAEAVAAQQSASPEQLRRRLQGDLDTICLTALQKDPLHRYASAGELLADVERHLDGLPVAARPGTLGYRLTKFASRHRAPVVAFTIVLLAFITLAVFYTVRLAEQRNRAQAEAEKAGQVSAFLIDLFEAGDPYAASSDSLDVHTLLQRGRERAEELAAQPEVQAKMLDVLGQVYMRLSRYEQAEPLLRQALTLRRRHLGADHLDAAESLANLGLLFHQQGAYDSAEVALREALAIGERKLPDGHPNLASHLDDLGVILSDKGDYKAAEVVYGRALQIRRHLYIEPHKDLGKSLNNMAVNFYYQGDYAAAEQYYREALAVDRAVFGPAHPEVATDLANLGKLVEEQEDYAVAESLLTEALRIRRAKLGEVHYETALSMSQLGGMLLRKGDYEQAAAYLREALAVYERVLGPDHPSVGTAVTNLARTLRGQGDLDGSETLFRRAVAIYRESLGGQHPYTATSLCNLADLLRRKGQYDAAEVYFLEGLAIFEAVLPPDHWQLAYNRNLFGALLVAESRFAEAEPLLLESYEKLGVHFGDRHQRTLEAARHLVALYEAWNKPEQADAYRRIRSDEG